MPSNLTQDPLPDSLGSYSELLMECIKQQNFSDRAVTVVGYGNMGRQYVLALQELGVRDILVVSKSYKPLEELKNLNHITTQSGGYGQINHGSQSGRVVIICTPIEKLIDTVRHLVDCGAGDILIEKPISLRSEEIRLLSRDLASRNNNTYCAYNRVSYPTVLEAKSLCQSEGGVTSCTYEFTEFVDRVEGGNFTQAELSRWGIANSLHVMSIAHGIIGMPKSSTYHRSGVLPWHKSGSVFVGSGISETDVPFSYHANWGSTGRWSVELHTSKSSYRLCPLEQLTRRDKPTGEWKHVQVKSYAPKIKYGVLEQVASLLSEEVNSLAPLTSLDQAVALTQYGEQIFGYHD